MKRYVCECCGANINPITLKCAYCGTQYKDEFDNLVRIHYCQEPIDTYRATVSVSDVDLKCMGEKAGEIISDILAHRLTEVIKRNISIDVKNMPEYRSQQFTGTIKTVRPIHDYNNMDREY